MGSGIPIGRGRLAPVGATLAFALASACGAAPALASPAHAEATVSVVHATSATGAHHKAKHHATKHRSTRRRTTKHHSTKHHSTTHHSTKHHTSKHHVKLKKKKKSGVSGSY